MELTTYAILKSYVYQVIKEGNLSGNGKSAYEIAVDNGFQGTEKEWLKSLQGETPYIGDNGNWFIGTVDTGVLATPDLSQYYSEENLIALSTEEILEICK